MAKATKPSRAFWENLTITAAFSADSPRISPAATTAPEVSMVPASHAPPTMVDMPARSTTQGMRMVIGTATTRTSEVT